MVIQFAMVLNFTVREMTQNCDEIHHTLENISSEYRIFAATEKSQGLIDWMGSKLSGQRNDSPKWL